MSWIKSMSSKIAGIKISRRAKIKMKEYTFKIENQI